MQGKQQTCLGSKSRNVSRLLLMSATRQRSRMTRTRAMTTRAMVNVDFASPSMLLGAVLIGGGVVLLQVCGMRVMQAPGALEYLLCSTSSLHMRTRSLPMHQDVRQMHRSLIGLA